jgi:hypothetical protein
LVGALFAAEVFTGADRVVDLVDLAVAGFAGADFAAGLADDALAGRVDVVADCLLAATYDLSPRVHTDGVSRCFDWRREDAG